MLYIEQRQEICEVAQMMFDRFLTNAAGGNISLKVSEQHYVMTPTLMSQARFCRLTPAEIIVIDRDGQVIEGEGRVTREFNMHVAAYEALPKAGAVIHAHPREAMVFASLGLPLPHLCENTRRLGEIITLPFAPATSQELADTVGAYLGGRREDIPVAALLREHGIIVADTSLRRAFDMLERIEYNAYVNLQAKLFALLGEDKRAESQPAFRYNLEE